MVQRNIFFTLLIFCLIACQSKKAVQLNTVLANSERTVFNIMVGKNGPNERKLKCIIDCDFKCALQAIDDKEQAFNKVINEINALEIKDVEYGNDLKKAAISYYDALKQLEMSDRREIALQQLSQDKNSTIQVRDRVTTNQRELLNQKLEMRKLINQKENKLSEVKRRFNSVNHLN
ncbi:hypothetical protein [Pedobacter sp. KLB.chiD]|uniref:hypothetical protein n=1 Tax=Pedobacter sp. KLB.chiD TaxID=3387402 RepID=UPI0039994D3D